MTKTYIYKDLKIEKIYSFLETFEKLTMKFFSKFKRFDCTYEITNNSDGYELKIMINNGHNEERTFEEVI